MPSESPDPLFEAVGRNIKRRRIAIGLSQESFAQRAGFLKQFANRVEAGRQNLSLRSLDRIAAALDTSIASLFDDVSKPRQLPPKEL